jgi:O-antigen/teichoic acid export membrane protein
MMAALLVSESTSLLVGLLPLRRKLRQALKEKPISSGPSASPLLPGFLLTVLAAVPNNVDVMLVSGFLPGVLAGTYGAVATMGRVVALAPMAVALPLVPEIARRQAEGRSSRDIVAQGLFFTLLLSAPIAIVYAVAPGPLLDIFFGESYRQGAYLLGWYGLAMVLFALNMVLAQYALALNRVRLLLYADVMVLLLVAGIVVWHATLDQVVACLLVGNSGVLILYAACLFGKRGTQVRSGPPAMPKSTP